MLSQTEYDRAFEIADVRLFSDSLNNCCLIEAKTEAETIEDNDHLNNIIELLELSALELQSETFDNNQDKNEFYKIYQDLFFLIRVLPIPQEEISKIKHIYKIIAYSYLGQKWESGRRFLIENSDIIKVNIKEEEAWDIRLFKKIYMAFIHLVRKNDWRDLTKASEFIAELRNEQRQYEKEYLSSLSVDSLKGGSYELFGLYHFAKAIDLAVQFMINGKPNEIREQIDFHFEKAVEASDKCSNIEMNLILNMLLATLKQMISNSIWMVTQRVNSRVTKFVQSITNSNKPVYELMYPQRHAILEKGLLDPAHKAVVVDMPTSSGKTLLAEFRMLQALNQFAEENGWVVYVAPTRALVNQVTARLKKDLGPIGLKVEKMSGALEIDVFEESLLTKNEVKFNVLVTTPEKLNLLVRDNIEENLGGRPLALAVIDEAHNIEDKSRGLNLELLMANIKNDCPKSNFLLLTPFIPNSEQVARWLDPDSPNAISIELSWTPNDRVIGVVYPEGLRREWKTIFETLITSNERIKIEKKVLIQDKTPINETRSNLNKTKLVAATTKQFWKRDGILAICLRPEYCWDLAIQLASEVSETACDEDIELVKRFISAELGEQFILKSLLDKRIGVHHSGLPDEVKYLMEWLMERNKLKVLVATTTIAQGINFPVSTILMASYAYPYTEHMPIRDFWNLVGRSGRTDQDTLGIVGIAVGEKESKKQDELNKVRNFVAKSTEELVSYMKRMVDEAIQIGQKFDLSSHFWKPEWSQLLQYITHMYNQCKELSEFETKAELFLRRTFGYNLIDDSRKKVLLEAVKEYGKKLDTNKGLATLSDSTGFSMEAINSTINKIKELGLTGESWNKSHIFSNSGDLHHLMGIMLTIPEIKSNLKEIVSGGSPIPGETLAQMTSDWVSGKDIQDIAKIYFNGEDPVAITECCRAIYGKLINSATWGLSSLQKLPNSGIDFKNMTEQEKKMLNNLPAMIYYGVNSDEAILMRINNIPRSAAMTIGQKFKKENNNIYDSTTEQVSSWLNNLPEEEWDKAVNKTIISGREYKKIWKILNGE